MRAIIENVMSRLDATFKRKRPLDGYNRINREYLDKLSRRETVEPNSNAPVVRKIDGGKDITCYEVDSQQEFQRLRVISPEIFLRKKDVKAYQATELLEVRSSQDGMVNTAEVGDWVVQNPGDPDPYVFGDKKKDSLQVRQEKFLQFYAPVEGQPGVFRRKGVIKAVPLDRNITFSTAWGATMSCEVGGVLTDQGYTIAKSSLEKDYVVVPPEKISPGST